MTTTTHKVVFQRSRKSFQVPHNTNLLSFVDKQDSVSINSLCRGGSCGTCKVKVLKGEVELETTKALRPGEQERGLILACSARVIGDLLLDV